MTAVNVGWIPHVAIETIETDSHGYPCAILEVEGELIEVTRRFGSWSTLPDETGRYREILPRYSAMLQKAARKAGIR